MRNGNNCYNNAVLILMVLHISRMPPTHVMHLLKFSLFSSTFYCLVDSIFNLDLFTSEILSPVVILQDMVAVSIKENLSLVLTTSTKMNMLPWLQLPSLPFRHHHSIIKTHTQCHSINILTKK